MRNFFIDWTNQEDSNKRISYCQTHNIPAGTYEAGIIINCQDNEAVALSNWLTLKNDYEYSLKGFTHN